MYNLALACFQRQHYVCSKGLIRNDLYHFGFGCSVYAHGSAPISKYMDIVVQALFVCSFTGKEPRWNVNEIEDLIEHCTYKENAGRKAGGACSDLYWTVFISKNQPFIANALVYAVRQDSFYALLLDYGKDVNVCKTVGKTTRQI